MDIQKTQLSHFSPSSINMFLRCPAQWYFRYIEGLIQPPAAVMVLGRSVDKALDSNYVFKMKEKVDKKLEEVLDVYSTTWEKEKEDVAWQKDEKPGDIKDNGIRVTTKYHTERAPNINPVESQRKISITLPMCPLPVIGYIDLLNEGNIIIDNKVKGISPSKNKAGVMQPSNDEIVQMTIYEHGLLEEGVEIGGMQLDCMITTKTPQIHQVQVKSTMDDLLYIQNITKLIIKAITAEIFLPNRGSFMCSQRHCGYFKECQKLYGGNIRE